MADPPGAVLIVTAGIDTPGKIALDEVIHVLGRLPHADIGLENPFVSRKHAQIEYSEDDYFIRDLGSKNGTYVNGVRLGGARQILEGGELLELGAGQLMATFSLGKGTETLGPDTPRTANAGPVVIDDKKREAEINGAPVLLSAKEFDVLSLLYDNVGDACSKDEIAARGWPERAEGGVSDQEIGQCIHRIRKRIEPDPGAPVYLQLVRGYGYRLNNTS